MKGNSPKPSILNVEGKPLAQLGFQFRKPREEFGAHTCRVGLHFVGNVQEPNSDLHIFQFDRRNFANQAKHPGPGMIETYES